jgi:glucose/arabinose dehydrogenase
MLQYGVSTTRQCARPIVRRLLIGVAALALWWIAGAPAEAQGLPGGPGAPPQLRRGPDGKLEAVPGPPAGGAPAVPAPRGAAPKPGVAPAMAATVGTRHSLSADKLPVPLTTAPDDLTLDVFPRPDGVMPLAPKGFSVTIFATRVGNARWLRVAPNGDVFMASSGDGRIVLLRDADGDGVAETVTTFAGGFKFPHGMGFRDGAFYVADVRAIWRLPYRDGDKVATGQPQRLTKGPSLGVEGWHWTREIAFDSKGKLYLAIGANADVADSDPSPSATIQEVAADGTMTIFASGLRNVVGMAVYPGTDELWGTVNERDKLGGGLPPDYLTRIRKGDFFGWPYAYVGPHPDPVYGRKRPDLVAKTKTPDVLFAAHSAPLAVVFYDGTQFPSEYRGDAFVAFHASGPYDKPDGYKVVRVKFANRTPVGGYEDFVTGFMFAGIYPPRVWGTPAGLAVAKDGSLLIADEGTIWRVAYTGK